jgi:hypothetical protein
MAQQAPAPRQASNQDSDPVFVLVGSLTFIASVFILHIVGKFMSPR